MQKSKPRTSSALTSFFAPGFLSKEDRHHISYMDFHTNWASVIIHIPLAFFAQCKNWWKFLAFSWLFAPCFMPILLSVYFPYWMHSTSLTRVISTSQEWFLRAHNEKIRHGILRGKEESPLRNFLSRFARRLGARFLQFSEFYWPTPN